MKRSFIAAAIAVVTFTVLFGLVYPLITTAVAQLAFPNQADGSQVEVDGQVVGSMLIGQEFLLPDAKPGPPNQPVPDPAYFQPRPSATGYSPSVTFFNNLGPNSRDLRNQIRDAADAYLELEGESTPGLVLADVPVDAVTTSASGVDPHISEANAEIQANRVAAERGLELDAVLALVDEHTAGRALGFLGEPGVNVLELNIAIDEQGS